MNQDPTTAPAGKATEPAIAGAAKPVWQRLLLRWARLIEAGKLTMIFPDGRQEDLHGGAPGPAATIQLHRGRVVWRMVARGDIGLAESYIDGDWSTPDLAALLEFGARNQAALSRQLAVSSVFAFVNRTWHRLRANSRRGSRRNISDHYDLGNDFYAQWLDPTMTYSSALFIDPTMALEDAQLAKYRRIAHAAAIRPGDSVLEIGCGWGGFAEFAAREFGCRVVGLTLSDQQAEFARRRMAEAGVDDRVEIRVQDYREVQGRFDRIVSIEMFEAVGEKYWPVFFDCLRQRLVEGGRAAMQIITIADEHFECYRRGVDFIQRYIFPGGMLPSPTMLGTIIRHAGLRLEQAHYIGQSYAETLSRWYQRFQRRAPEIAGLGYDERFRRMWEFYLCYCRAGFRSGQIDVAQLVIERA